MSQTTLLRRSILRFGCGLCLAAVLAPAVLAQTVVKKMAQTSVRYQAQPKGNRSCGNCINFIAGSGTCKLVDGSVSPDGWCNLWGKKL